MAAAAEMTKAELCAILEMSTYDSALLERHLARKRLLPASSNDRAVRNATFKLRNQAFHTLAVDFQGMHSPLTRLFHAFNDSDDEQDQYDGCDDMVGLQRRVRALESAKYDAVIALLAVFTDRQGEPAEAEQTEEVEVKEENE